MVEETEEIINEVHKHPLLYDTSHSDYKNIRKKNQVWEEIGKRLGISGENLKKRWRSLKDCYIKHLRSEQTHTGQTAKQLERYRTWPWANQMSIFKRFLRWYLDGTQTTFLENSLSTQEVYFVLPENLDAPDTTASATTLRPMEPQLQNSTANTTSTIVTPEPSFGVLSSSPAATTRENKMLYLNEPSTSRAFNSATVASRTKKRRSSTQQHVSESYTNTLLNYLKSRNAMKPNYDEIDLICLGYAKTIKKFSAERQTLVKFEIAKLLMEQELAHIRHNRERSPASDRSKQDIVD